MKLFTKQTEARLGSMVLAAYVIAQLYSGKTFTFHELTREANPGGFWLSVIMFSVLSLFLLIFSFMSKKKQRKFNKLVNDTKIENITSSKTNKKYNKSVKQTD